MNPLTPSVGLGFSHGSTYPLAAAGRPLLPLDLAAVDSVGRLLGRETVVVLLDSGADSTMLHADFAQKLGLNLATMKQIPVKGVGGTTVAYEHKVLARLCGAWSPVRVLFEPGRDINLLGRENVFDRIRIGLLQHAGAGLILAAPHP